MKRYSTYLFDFDGTLFDTCHSMYPVFRAGFQKIGLDCTAEEAREFMHLSVKDVVAIKGVKEEDVALFCSTLMKVIDEPEIIASNIPFVETEEILSFIRKSNIPMGIVSGNSSVHISNVLNHWKMKGDEVLVGNDVYSDPKPSAEPLLLALRMMGIPLNKDICYVGDSMQDMKAAEAAGLEGILIDRENYYPDYSGVKITSLKDLFE